eukprot:m.76764 g.76764  ORF g.76764 m.76764 type:complete len:615 (-) comp14523_c1_seq1:67-1911(-)
MSPTAAHLVAVVTVCSALLACASAKPNIVVLLSDDFGWGDLASYGHGSQEWGNIDDMAAQGMRFTKWYSGESLCTPSRAAIMTGRLPVRTGMVPVEGSEARVLAPTSTGGLPESEYSFGDLMRKEGYRTGLVGKYHLGINKATKDDGAYLPINRGFDYVGTMLPFSNHWACDESGRHEKEPNPSVCFLYRNNSIIQQPIDHSNLTATLVADANHFIESSANKPFFLYFSTAHMHVAMFTSTTFANSSANGIWGSNLREMDWAVGQILAKLRELHLDSNTLVFFTSDHGPHIELCLEGGNAGGLRGGKAYSSWEGGLRVPGIAWWPGTIAAGSVSHAPVSSMDMLATAVDVAGGTLPTDRLYDGSSLKNLLTGATTSSPHQFLFHYCASRLMAVRYGHFKIRMFTEALPADDYADKHCTHGSPHGEFFQTWNCFGNGVVANNPPELLNVDSDVQERFLLDTRSTCSANGTILPDTGMPGVAYAHVGLPAGGTQEQLIEQCRAQCCNQAACGSVTLELAAPAATAGCHKGQPCCYFNPLMPSPTTSRPGVIVAFVKRRTGGPHAEILDDVAEAVHNHFASRIAKQPQLGPSSKTNQPCCGTDCHCNYPNPSHHDEL